MLALSAAGLLFPISSPSTREDPRPCHERWPVEWQQKRGNLVPLQPGKRFTLTPKTKKGEKPSVRLLGAGSEDLAPLPNLSLLRTE